MLAPDDALARVVAADMAHWLETAVVGLNLCPFAKAVQVRGQIRFAVSTAADPDGFLQDLRLELNGLMAAAPPVRETTLLMAAACLDDFWQFNAFLQRAQKLLRDTGLEGTLQLASFHPDYQFADAQANAITNYTNRAPYPTLHLLREASVDRAVAAFPEAAVIFECNMTTLERLGADGWSALGIKRSTPRLAPGHGDLAVPNGTDP